jgi:histidinol-phosphate aminotransferase
MSRFARKIVQEMAGYTPGEQPARGEKVIKLNTNENPFPPSPKVMEAIKHIDPEYLRRYPDPNARIFCEAAAKVHDVPADWILTGNGSDDLLAVAMLTFLSPGDVLAYPEPTYSLYPVLAQLDEVKVKTMPWGMGGCLPIDALLSAKARAAFICNPNAPTATFVPTPDLERFVRKFDGLVLIDEAYVDFADENALPLVKKYDNVVILRTLSKGYCLAGLRFGYAIAQPSVIQEMNKAKDSYPCDAVSIFAATAAITDQEYAKKTWQFIRDERARVTSEFAKLGWSVIPTHTNFFLATVPSGNGREIYLKLKQRGILVRYFDKPGLTDKLRITIGTKEQNDQLLSGIKKM